MMNTNAGKFAFALLLSALFFSNSMALFAVTYVFVFLVLFVHTLQAKTVTKRKILLSLIYLALMVFQLTHNALRVFAQDNTPSESIRSKILGVLIVLAPFVIYWIAYGSKNAKNYLPSIQDMTVFTFHEILDNINSVKGMVNKGYKTLSKENINELLSNIPRHDSFRYISKGSLTEEYFKLAYEALDDLNIYIIISNTGSPASEIISLFTQKQYNHTSLSFDRNLKTILSYNGGEKLYPPGLNMEMVHYFNRKKDSGIIVYSVLATSEKKKKIIDQIREINRQGSAYNVFGLVFKFSLKPNIMFCSQFVYKMLKIAELNYFEKKDGKIKPTDFVEMDYYRKLKYEYEIKFNENKTVPDSRVSLMGRGDTGESYGFS
jgi:hypothetical protein